MFTVYADIMTFVNAQADRFISSKTAAIAAAIEPAAVTLLSVYVMIWGFSHIRGLIQEPFMDFLTRMIKIVAIVAIGLSLWGYNEYIVDTFVKSPDSLASAIAGGQVNTQGLLDKIMLDAYNTGNAFFENAGVMNGNFGGYIVAAAVWLAGILVTAYSAVLIIMAKIFLTVLVALGPLFIVGLLFDSTSRYFESWIGQLSNYALLTPLVTGANVFVLEMFSDFAGQAAQLGGDVKIAEIVPLLITAAISMMVLNQIPSTAAGLGGGIAVSTMGVGRKMLGKAWGAASWAPKKAGQATLAAGAKGTKVVARKAWNAYQTRRNKVDKAA